MASSSSMHSKEVPPDWITYPSPLASYEDVIASPQTFMDTLQKLHKSMSTKFMIPIVGGKDLDLHRLFMEVTSRGGFTKLLKERKWKDITAVFNFPSSATNASFILRKYYYSLLVHYEQIYYFKAKGWSPSSSGLVELSQSSPENRLVLVPPQQRTITANSNQEVHGIIDGKFDSGYLITVKIGSEVLRGVLYQTPSNQIGQETQTTELQGTTSTGVQRRKRRKKSEMKKRDPAHPKPNRSGYNFFFADQHAKLKPLHPGKDREISRMIGELWSNLKEPEKSVYQELAMKDKERYKTEMEDYKERLRLGIIVSEAVPIQQLNIVENKPESEAVENETSSDKSYLEDSETADKDVAHEGEKIRDGSEVNEGTSSNEKEQVLLSG